LATEKPVAQATSGRTLKKSFSGASLMGDDLEWSE